MSFKNYYQSELSALRQHASLLCERQPALKAFFGQGARDPDVERLIEGTSFLTGRLREKIDDELPEITHGLTQRLWGNYLRPMPSMSIVQFDPLKKSGPGQQVPRNAEIKSCAIEGVSCGFRTVYDIEVLPLVIDRLEHAYTGDGAVLTLSLNMAINGHLGELNLQRLRLHLTGNASISQALYLALTRHLRAVRVTLLDANGSELHDQAAKAVRLNLDPQQITAAGFGDDEGLVPHPVTTYSGYRLVQEFFVFQEKFLFIDVLGLGQINNLHEEVVKRASGLSLRFEFSKFNKQATRPTIDNIKLYCAPIINLFSHQAFPVDLEMGQQNFPVLPENMAAEHCEVFSVQKVYGSQPAEKAHHEYLPFETCQPGLNTSGDSSTTFYSLSHQQSVMNEGLITTISFKVENPATQTVAIDLTCTNRNLPSRLKVGDICVAGSGIPGLLTFKNISVPTPGYAPPLEGDYLWRLISNMSLNYLSLTDVDALREILQLYDLPAFHDGGAQRSGRQFFATLQRVSHQNIDYLMLGRPVRGTRTLLNIVPQGPEQEAQWFLLGNVLDHFFALYASAHSFSQLQIISSSGESWLWGARPGQQLTL